MDEIKLSFGGESLTQDSSENPISTNAYMLMYRQIDQRRNKNPMSKEEFPQHIKDLHNLLKRETKDKENRHSLSLERLVEGSEPTITRQIKSINIVLFLICIYFIYRKYPLIFFLICYFSRSIRNKHGCQ